MPARSPLASSGEQTWPRWPAGTYRVVDYRGRRPPELGADEWGVTWAPLPAGGKAAAGGRSGGLPGRHVESEIAGSYPVGHPFASVRQVLEAQFPDGCDPMAFAGQPWAVPAREADPIGGVPVLLAGRHPLGPLDRLCALLGPERGLLALVEEPDAARAALDRIAGYHAAIAAAYLAAGCTAGWLADEYAGASGPFVSPALWRQLILPGLRRIVAIYQAAGAPVCFHMCGRAEAFAPDLLAAGIDAFDLEVQ